MIRFRSSSDQHTEEQHLLQSLLHDAIPSAPNEPLRPVALRSIDAQRRIALKHVLQRTWVDVALYRVERVLMMVVGVVFVVWFAQSYGYDWLYHHSYRGFFDGTVAHTTTTNDNTMSYPRNTYHLQQSRRTTLAYLFPSPAMLLSHSYQCGATATTALYLQRARALPFSLPNQPHRIAAIPDYLAPQPVAIPDAPTDCRPYRLVIPSIGLDTPVKEVFIEHGVWQVADYAAGFHHGTALPGEVGNSVMAGHAGIRGSVFHALYDVHVGDDILVEAGGWHYRYTVSNIKRVLPTDVAVMAPTPTSILTLITCTDWDTKRFIVVAHLVGSRPL